jgi:hypothetical protein
MATATATTLTTDDWTTDDWTTTTEDAEAYRWKPVPIKTATKTATPTIDAKKDPTAEDELTECFGDLRVYDENWQFNEEHRDVHACARPLEDDFRPYDPTEEPEYDPDAPRYASQADWELYGAPTIDEVREAFRQEELREAGLDREG